MKISLAQIYPKKGNIQENIKKHISFIEEAIKKNSDLIVFPELSLSSYEPTLASELALYEDSPQLNCFQELADLYSISISVGLPIRKETNIHISMLIFQKNQVRKHYSKQYLYKDEFPFFSEAKNENNFMISGVNTAFGICYELSVAKHHEEAIRNGADIYIISAVKDEPSIDKSNLQLAEISAKYKIPCFLVNSVGFADRTLSFGNSAAYLDGKIQGHLNNKDEGLLTYNLSNNKIDFKYIPF